MSVVLLVLHIRLKIVDFLREMTQKKWLTPFLMHFPFFVALNLASYSDNNEKKAIAHENVTYVFHPLNRIA